LSGAASGGARFVLYSRDGCGLCDEMQAALAALPCVKPYPIDVVDVDADAVTRMRHGHKIPVLLFAGELVCHGHLDLEELYKALACHLRPV
jgi:hypothetical protein